MLAAFKKLPERANEPEALHGTWWQPPQSAAGSAGDLPETVIDDMWSHLDEANKNLDMEQETGSPFPSAQRSPSPPQQVTPIVVRQRSDDAQHAGCHEQHAMAMEHDSQHSAGAGVQQHGMGMEHDRQQAAGVGVQQHDKPIDPPPEQQQAAGVEAEVAADVGVQQHAKPMEAADQQAAGAHDKEAEEEAAAPSAPSTPGKEEAPAPQEAAAPSAPSTPGKEEAPAPQEPAPQEPEVPAPDQDKLDRSQQQLVLNWLGRRATAKRGTPASKQEAANAKELYMTLTNAQKVMFFDSWKRRKMILNPP